MWIIVSVIVSFYILGYALCKIAKSSDQRLRTTIRDMETEPCSEILESEDECY